MKVAHVNAAVEETFDSLHMQMMCSAPRLEKLLLAALVLETRFTGKPWLLRHWRYLWAYRGRSHDLLSQFSGIVFRAAFIAATVTGPAARDGTHVP